MRAPGHLRAKRWAAVPFSLLRPLRRVPPRWVLLFHEVGDHRWGLSPERFEAILVEVLRTHAPVALGDLLSAAEAPKPRFAVTFDDGYVGVAARALPVLERLGVPATVFVASDLVGDEDARPTRAADLYEGLPLMGWRSLSRLAARGVAIESHGAAHADLLSMTDDARREDLTRSRGEIERRVGRVVRYLAYPFGRWARPVARASREAGYLAAFTTRHGGLGTSVDPFAVPRFDVRAAYQPADVRAALRGDWAFLALAQRLRSAVPGRPPSGGTGADGA